MIVCIWLADYDGPVPLADIAFVIRGTHTYRNLGALEIATLIPTSRVDISSQGGKYGNISSGYQLTVLIATHIGDRYRLAYARGYTASHEPGGDPLVAKTARTGDIGGGCDSTFTSSPLSPVFRGCAESGLS